jgi:hypothetical protein
VAATLSVLQSNKKVGVSATARSSPRGIARRNRLFSCIRFWSRRKKPLVPENSGIPGVRGGRWQFPLKAIAPCSWTPEEYQVESCAHQDNANIHC